MDEKKQNETVEKRQTKEKEAILEQLKRMPIVQVACERSAVSRATYYRWRSEDSKFLQAADVAIHEGALLINDMSESQLVMLIKEKKMPAITLWLKHNHPRYGAKTTTEPTQSSKVLSPEQENTIRRALRLVRPKRAIPYNEKTGQHK